VIQAGPAIGRSKAATWLINHGHGSEIITTSKFEDFELHVEFNCGPQSNSGVYLRDRYEVQIETDSVQKPPTHHTGGVSGFLAPSPELLRKPGEWQTFDITSSDEPLRLCRMVKPSSTTRKFQGLPVALLTATKSCLGLSTFRVARRDE
jgi:3-keto-disaccharide hydrolase